MRPQDYKFGMTSFSAADGGGPGGVVPELPGCRSDGETRAEALADTYDAIDCWIEAAQVTGRVVPQPRSVIA